ncbi:MULTISPECIES: serine hydrolase domain-containing protein [unclassified Psychrobacter]|uniref:serine hydrolase domain-containing protein n=1 Tax=unclassified Psychrobacter TaxID=196806 RepID=UPI00071E79F1|nr:MULTISPECIES: serine hydrolase domain-containing protein [unclassified Psychrobacter]OLF37656.1 hypothetical protein BTV98_08655 [Psychrobacter sp. Cmf 22.2]
MVTTNKKTTIIYSLVILLSLLFILGGTYLYTAQHLLLSRLSYHLQVPFIKSTIHCSDGAPEFMYELMNNLVTEQKSMSNQIVYQNKEGERFHCESGWEDGFRGDNLITINSRFRYASVSKIVTSAIVLDLINQNKVQLDQKLLDVIEIPKPKDERIQDITIAMLLEHSAGFDRYKSKTAMLKMDIKPWCPTDLEDLAGLELDFEPKTQFQYSNVGYCLLGAVVEQVTKRSFHEVARESYGLDDKDIQFVKDGMLPDEIVYDYRYENFFSSDYYTHFDFKDSLYAIGGLAGSANAMVSVTQDMLLKEPLNILSRAKSPCAIDKIGGCYGYALEPYQKTGHSFTIYNKSGYFPGVNNDIFVDDKGGILAVYRGASAPSFEAMQKLKELVYARLNSYYKLDSM